MEKQKAARSVLRLFLIIYLPVMAFVGITSLTLYRTSSDATLATLKTREMASATEKKILLSMAVAGTITDLMVLKSNNALKRWSEKDDAHSLAAVANELLDLSHYKSIYDQARLLGLDGMELVRVNFNYGRPTQVPENRLQNKAKRYYFRDSQDLELDEVFISPLDLNIEYGKIEQPIKPVIRIGTPIFNGSGIKKGFLLVNYLARPLIDEVKPHAEDAGQLMLLNANGYWMKGIRPEDEWGFMYPARKEKRFANRFPKAWEAMQSTEQGQFLLEEGLFSFAVVRPFPNSLKTSSGSAEPYAPSGGKMGMENYRWIVVSHLPRAIIDSRLSAHRARLIIVYLGLGIMFGIGSWIGASAISRRRQAEQELKESEERFRSVTQTANEAIIAATADGSILSWNKGAEKIFGYAEDEVVGRSLTILMPEHYREPHENGMRHLNETGKPRILGTYLELQGLRKDGSEFEIGFSLATWRASGENYYGGIIQDISERKEMEAELERLATVDALTGLLNRAAFNSRIEEELSRAKRYRLPLSLMILDIDHFKAINDRYGHPAGDACLVAFGEIIERVCRSIDIAARYGGEEFIIIQPQATEEKAYVLAERLRTEAEISMTRFDGEAIQWSISIGIASLDLAQDLTAEEWVKQADKALYHAKQSGRNRVCRFNRGVSLPV